MLRYQEVRYHEVSMTLNSKLSDKNSQVRDDKSVFENTLVIAHQ